MTRRLRARWTTRLLVALLLLGSGIPLVSIFIGPLIIAVTWRTWSTAFAEAPPVTELAELDLASPGTVLALVRAVADDVRVLVVVGHEPVQSALTRALAGPGSSASALVGLAAGFSTGAVAVLEVEGPWAALQPLGGRLARFAVPRG